MDNPNPSPRDKLEAAKRRRRLAAWASYEMWRERYCDEALSPSFPPRLNYNEYPMRSGSGALVVYQISLGWSGPYFTVINVAEDGQRWLTVHETLPEERFWSPDGRL